MQVKDRFFLIYDLDDSSKSLSDILDANTGVHMINSDACEYALYCIARGVQTLHSKDIVIANLTSSSVWSGKDGVPQITNLSQCAEVSEGAQTKTNLEQRMEVFSAPEVRKSQECTKASDIWSLGVIAYMLATGETEADLMGRDDPDFSSMEGTEGDRQSQVSSPEKMQDSFNLKDCSENFLTFIQACMQTDVGKRKTID